MSTVGFVSSRGYGVADIGQSPMSNQIWRQIIRNWLIRRVWVGVRQVLLVWSRSEEKKSAVT